MNHDYVFWHTCTEPDCNRSVEFDDEPFCFAHSKGKTFGYLASEHNPAQRLAARLDVLHKDLS